MELVCKTVVFFLLVSTSLGIDGELAQDFVAIAGPLPTTLAHRLHLQSHILPKEALDPTVSEAHDDFCQQDTVISQLPQYFSHLREIGVTHYKVFLPWARILPDGDAKKPDEAQVRCYQELLKMLVAADLRPVIVLHHKGVPDTVAVGRKASSFADLFVDYAEFSFYVFGGLADMWLTFSDLPELLESLPYSDSRVRVQALAAAHERAYSVYHEKYSGKNRGKDFCI